MMRSRPLSLVTAALLLAPQGAFANPLNGQVAAGSATIQGQGTSTVTITQSSNRAIINWNTFNLSAGETTRFVQPDSSAVALNRVTGGLGPSSIYGTVTANGRVFLVNPDGILFGAGSRIDAAGFLATTHDIANANFMAGNYVFNIPGRLDASIVNFGRITASSGGFAALVAPGVRNAGTITANLGHVALASGNGFTLDFYGDKLITLQVGDQIASKVLDVSTGQPLDALVKNEGTLRANGGQVALTAAAARQVVDAVINNTGVIEANSVGTKSGMIVLGAATAADKGSGAATQTVKVSGTLSAAGHKAGTQGGTIQITGESIAIAGAKVNVSGQSGGGTVLIGGDTGGGAGNPAMSGIALAKPWPTATTVSIDAATVINASAITSGDGGRVVVRSTGLTTVAGLIRASGGAVGGNGGFVETSGQTVDFTGIRVDTSAPKGHTGLWLVDPTNLIVDSNAAATISTNLATTSVTLQTSSKGASGPGIQTSGAGDIIINSPIAWSSANTLTLDSYHGIKINAPITISGPGGLNLSAAYDPILTSVLLLSFGNGANVQFTGIPHSGQSLVINGQSYTLLYSMSDVQNINATSESLAGFYALARPLDAGTVVAWTPIGTDVAGNILNGGSGFAGAFQGLGNTISNLTINLSNTNYVGLFGYVGSSGVIANTGLVGGAASGGHNSNVGDLVGFNLGTIAGSYATGAVTGGSGSAAHAGGLVGFNGGTVTQSYATGEVNGPDNYVGGLVGMNGGTISQSYATGAVTGGTSDAGDLFNKVGGLVGANNGTITRSYATGAVTGGTDDVGGLVGGNGGIVTQSYATGAVNGSNGGSNQVGGLIGFNGGTVTQSYATGTVNGTAISFGTGGLVGVNAGSVSESYATGAITGTSNVGGLVGYNSGLVTRSYATGAVTGAFDVGGLVGYNDGTVTKSYATGSVSGSQDVGGLVGFNGQYATIVGSHSSSTVTVGDGADWSQAIRAGGLVGENWGSITLSHATGNVTAGGNTIVGGLVGANQWTGVVSGSYATGAVRSESVNDLYASNIGGLAGSNNGLITSSYATGNVSNAGSSTTVVNAGGLVGINFGTITTSYATGNVSISNVSAGHEGDTVSAGGLVGANQGGASIADSYAIGNVTIVNDSSTHQGYAGGLAGNNGGSITGSYASGAVSTSGTGTSFAGGLVGFSFDGAVTSSYWDKQTTGQQHSAGSADSFGFTTDQARRQSSYAGWNFSSDGGTWFMVDGQTRPFLQSEWSATITNAHQLQLMAMDLNAHYRLASNIDVGGSLANPSDMWSSQGFVPIGQFGNPFSGTFNGRGHTISDLKIAPAVSDAAAIGLFGVNTGTIRNVGLINETVSFVASGASEILVGGLVGLNLGEIRNSSASGNVGGVVFNPGTSSAVGFSLQMGGLVGVNAGTIDQSFASANVTSPTVDASSIGINQVGMTVGGLVGTNFAGTVTSTQAQFFNMPGLAGQTFSGTISDSYAAANVGGTVVSSNANAAGDRRNGFLGVGGLVGANFGTISGAINFPAGGSVNARVSITEGLAAANLFDLQVGGLVGNNGGTIVQSNTNFTVTATRSGFALNSDANGLPLAPYAFAVGGLAGQNTGTIDQSNYRNSFTVLTVNGRGASVGGLVGVNGFGDSGNATISLSSATGGVKTTGPGSVVGGLVGINGDGSTITQSYASGAVSGTGANTLAGGFAGANAGTITSSYWDTITTGQGSQGFGFNSGSFGAAGLTTAQFGNAANFVGWNFGTNPGGATCGSGGACWVIVDGDGSFNNAGGAAGATRPLLLTHYSTTITDLARLQLMGLAPDAHYRLAFNLINAGTIVTNPAGIWGPNNNAGFVPIGPAGAPFTGTFDGRGHSIDGLVIAPTVAGLDSIGLFGVNAGVIRNLNLTNVSITADPNSTAPSQYVGTLAGLNFGLISNVTATGTVDGGKNVGVIAGGLVGQNAGTIVGHFDTEHPIDIFIPGVIRNSSANVTVTVGSGVSCFGDGCSGGWNYAGGLVGLNGGVVIGSSASGDVTSGSNSFAGGLVGANQNFFGIPFNPLIAWSSATGNVTSAGINVSLGGLVGFNDFAGVIGNSRATGNVTSTATVKQTGADCTLTNSCESASAGGLVGQNFGLIEGRRLPSSDHGCVAGWTCASGAVSVGAGGQAGGLVGFNSGLIRKAFETGAVSVGSNGTGGGLVGFNNGTIWKAFATGDVTGAGGSGIGNDGFGRSTTLGGLVGENNGVIARSFATGDVGTLGVNQLEAGGLVGFNSGTIWRSYAGGNVSAGNNSNAGGLVGDNNHNDFVCDICAPGFGQNDNALISRSSSSGTVTVGAESIAGGLVGGNRGTIKWSHTSSDVTGGHDSILGGLVGVADFKSSTDYSSISHASASGSVTSTGANSIVAGLVGVNAGDIRDSHSSGAVNGTSDSYLGGLVGINIGGVLDSTTNGAVTGSGSGNVTGGFVAVNAGMIDPSSSSGSVSSGANSVVGGFAGGNVSFANIPAVSIPNSSFPNGTISSDSFATGSASGGPGSTVNPFTATTSVTPGYPALPSLFGNCNAAICQILSIGLQTPSTPPPPPPPPPGGSDINPPPPIQLVLAPPSNQNNGNPPPILINLPAPGGGSNGANGGNKPAGGNGGNGAGPPPNTGPPPGPGFGRTLSEQRFSGVPPIGETRFLPGEIVVQVSNTISLDRMLEVARELGITLISSQSIGSNGRVVYRFRAANGKDIRKLIPMLEHKNIVASAQPNYVFVMAQSAAQPTAQPTAEEGTGSIPPATEGQTDLANSDTASLSSLPAGDAAQYVIDKLHLGAIHQKVRGRNVTVAVIDSEIDVTHPDLKGVIVERFDATASPSRPHPHGTGMAGAIASRSRLLGVAPGARILAIKAFDETASSAEATSFQILKGLDYAISRNVRIINMSFAGPRDLMMERTLKTAHDKGIILIAAAGNAGPKSPPLYPGADESVIAVTATDYADKPFGMANRGKYIAVAAPGVDVMVPAPGNTYQLTTGTSVAAAHVSGVAALLVESKPGITPDELRSILMHTAKTISARAKDDQTAAGLVDPVDALQALVPGRAVDSVPRTSGANVH